MVCLLFWICLIQKIVSTAFIRSILLYVWSSEGHIMVNHILCICLWYWESGSKWRIMKYSVQGSLLAHMEALNALIKVMWRFWVWPSKMYRFIEKKNVDKAWLQKVSEVNYFRNSAPISTNNVKTTISSLQLLILRKKNLKILKKKFQNVNFWVPKDIYCRHLLKNSSDCVGIFFLCVLDP